MATPKIINPFYKTNLGEMILGDSLEALNARESNTVDLIITSPPYALIRKKEYGNVHADEYCKWFKSFAKQFHRVLKGTGSLVIDIGGTWIEGQPTRSLYHFKLLIMLCEEIGFHLAQEHYWWNPCRYPNPTEWVNIRHIRVIDAVNTVWWLSKTPWPKASNQRVLQPSRTSMKKLVSLHSQKEMKHLSRDQVVNKLRQDNKAAIPSNLIALTNLGSKNNTYLQYCRKKGLPVHPARFPTELPEYFIRMLTDEGDTVVDPFGGSCMTGEVCERLNRRWHCIELSKGYLKGAIGRFKDNVFKKNAANDVRTKNMHVQNRGVGDKNVSPAKEFPYYVVPQPGVLWDRHHSDLLRKDGGMKRQKSMYRALLT